MSKLDDWSLPQLVIVFVGIHVVSGLISMFTLATTVNWWLVHNGKPPNFTSTTAFLIGVIPFLGPKATSLSVIAVFITFIYSYFV